MATWTDYWRIVKPSSTRANYVAQDYNQTGSAYTNYSWYSQVMKGSASRFQKYSQINAMDYDVDMSRALDTIAEEMSNKNAKTDVPFDLVYQNDDSREIEESITVTLRASLKHWCQNHDFDNRIFSIARQTIKFGDCFFRKTSDFKKWIYVDPLDVLGIELDKDENAVSYHLRKGDNKTGSFGDVQIIPASGMLHFSLSNRMGDTGPFGESVLTPIIKAFKQLGMLEDAIIIYRIVRAPERRVFFIDVGNMPPQKAKTYLEAVKNEVRQKRIPNAQGGTENVDGVYNPVSMLEDYFFSTTANGRGSRVETLPGGENLGEITDLNYFQEKVFRGLRIPASYMRGGNDKGGAQTNDGKVGIAYIEELRFANFVMRLQNKIEKNFDAEFKLYLKAAKINIDPNLFMIKLPEPSNFALYKQAAVDAELINTFNAVEQIDYVSKRFALRRYLKWTEDDEQLNETLLRQERNIPEDGYGDDLSDLRMIYDPKWKDNRPDIKVPEDFENTGGEEEEPAAGAEEKGAEGDSGTGKDDASPADDAAELTGDDKGGKEKPEKDDNEPPKL